MAKNTLAQDERYLKRLDQNFTEISQMRDENCDLLRKIEVRLKDAIHLSETSWSYAIELLAASKYYELMLDKSGQRKS